MYIPVEMIQMIPQNISKQELAHLLTEKHRNFVKEYRREYSILDRIYVLKEKIEQLSYWVEDSKDNPTLHQKYLQAAEKTSKELSDLQHELKSLYKSKAKTYGPPEEDSRARHSWLKNQIDKHETAAAYWEKKTSEYAEEVRKEAAAEEVNKEVTSEPSKKTKKTAKTQERKKKTKEPTATT